MGVNWPELKIDQLKSQVKGSIAMGPFGSRIKAENFVTSGVPVIKGAQLHGAYVSDINFDYLTEEKALELSSSIAVRRDLVITHRGTIGQVCIIPDDSEYEKYIVSQSQLKVTLDQTKINPYFANYFFRSRLGQHRLLANASQVGVPAIAKASTSVKEILVPCPELSVQQRVVDILRSLDEKIELNRQMNETLEAMAQALFKSWFVDFDPVIDNSLAAGNEIPEPLQKRAAARQALGDQRKSLPAKIQSLFPDSFVFTNEMGWVPEGWKVQSVDESLIINPRLALPKGKTAPFVDMKALPTAGFSVSDVIRKEFNGGSKFQQGDVLFARITPCLENGKTAVVDFLNVEEVGFGSTEFIVLRGKDGISTSFVCCLSRHPKFRSHCEQGMVGSSGRQRVQNSSFNDYYLALPAPENLLQYFDSYTTSYFERISNKRRESETLSELRDALLPKLLSGELRIPDAEKQVAEAV